MVGSFGKEYKIYLATRGRKLGPGYLQFSITATVFRSGAGAMFTKQSHLEMDLHIQDS